MGMNVPQAPESPGPESDPAQVRDPDVLMVAYHHKGDISAPGDQESDLTLYFMGQGG